MNAPLIGVDLGGSHVTAAAVGTGTGPRSRRALDSFASAESILQAIQEVLREAIGPHIENGHAAIVGIALPGPFDYERGVFERRRGEKFGSLFGYDLVQGLRHSRVGYDQIAFFCSNDAQSFGWGDWTSQRCGENTLAITLGTGIGSAFILDGRLELIGGGQIPPNGELYAEMFRGLQADETFSTRGLIRRYRECTGVNLPGAREIEQEALNGNNQARMVLQVFGEDLGVFLAPWIGKLGIKRVRLGGNISRAGELITLPLAEALRLKACPAEIGVCGDTEWAALEGAALLAQDRQRTKATWRRKTCQEPLPLNAPAASSSSAYSIYPSHSLPSGQIMADIGNLAERLLSQGTQATIDGYEGVFWNDFQDSLTRAFASRGVVLHWICVDCALRPAPEIEKMVSPYLGDAASIFGRRFDGELTDFFDPQSLSDLKPFSTGFTILYGCGATMANWQGPIVYIDLPKNELQFRLRAKSVRNLGRAGPLSDPQAYKRCYFIDWVVLNRHKRTILPRLDYFVDGQREDGFTWIKGDDLRKGLQALTGAPLRARPWFEPGVWGGDWMKQNIPGLNQSVPNYAWSFELITPENGLVFGSDSRLLEVSFDCLLYHDAKGVLGRAAERFGEEFPLRFDFLDTWNGDKLSIQVHPRPDYIREYFGENFTQDETYYILRSQPGANVYLGLSAGTTREDLQSSLQASADESRPWEADKYVQCFPAHEHDLFLIPHGTIHGSGRGNLVLEISSTPYIFTFKLYDWLRLDLEGKPRPLNINHGMANLELAFAGDSVSNDLISRPQLIENGADWKRWRLPTHERHFYQIERYEFETSITVQDCGHCHIMMLVQGGQAQVVTEMSPDQVMPFNFAETIVVPAGARSFTITNRTTGSMGMLVVARVKDDHDGMS